MKKSLLLWAFALIATSTFAQYEVGAVARDFSLKNVDNKMVALADYDSAKGFVVVFTCNHCPFSVAYEDRIIALDNKYASKGYPVIAINPNDAVAYPDDNFDAMVVRAEEKAFPFPYLVDETQEIAKAYGATKTPHVYVLQKVDGKLIVKYIGAIDNNSKDVTKVTKSYVELAIDELLAGNEVTTASVPAVGCSVKYKK